jgi:hypothetical protein
MKYYFFCCVGQEVLKVDGCVIYVTLILLNGAIAGYKLWAVDVIFSVEH